ncbi:hypothetical protein H6G74_09245 [Nostoc spongiaeforme FACHB-130]|uniref:C2 domain-containing protein n=1 Tax=Nostoc spongiaeforme FACHB-130 TaxID=1357510 RepID=A0ABR8FSU0_9NOSO|nr:hypothetical protein [Nostoc spongiaeforme]MBD2594510.1 hypothetical protein [Nostoc spongiaeforme FACHB-130]
MNVGLRYRYTQPTILLTEPYRNKRVQVFKTLTPSFNREFYLDFSLVRNPGVWEAWEVWEDGEEIFPPTLPTLPALSTPATHT